MCCPRGPGTRPLAWARRSGTSELWVSTRRKACASRPDRSFLSGRPRPPPESYPNNASPFPAASPERDFRSSIGEVLVLLTSRVALHAAGMTCRGIIPWPPPAKIWIATLYLIKNRRVPPDFWTRLPLRCIAMHRLAHRLVVSVRCVRCMGPGRPCAPALPKAGEAGPPEASKQKKPAKGTLYRSPFSKLHRLDRPHLFVHHVLLGRKT